MSSGVETLCLHGRAAQLCSELYRWCEAHISSEIGRLIQECNIPETPQTHPMPKRPRLSSPDSHQDAVDTLRRVDKIWSSHCQQMALLISIFLYLERTYIRPTAPGFTSLWSMGIKLFAQNFNRHPIATHRIIEALLGLVKDERDGGKIDRVSDSLCLHDPSAPWERHLIPVPSCSCPNLSRLRNESSSCSGN